MSDVMVCERCGSEMTLEESSRGGLCAECVKSGARFKRGNILLKAHEVINGQRQDAYGNPEDCHGTIARLWSVWVGKELTAHDAAIMLALMKVARMKHGAGSKDSYVDCCGYVALASDMTGLPDA